MIVAKDVVKNNGVSVEDVLSGAGVAAEDFMSSGNVVLSGDVVLLSKAIVLICTEVVEDVVDVCSDDADCWFEVVSDVVLEYDAISVDISAVVAINAVEPSIADEVDLFINEFVDGWINEDVSIDDIVGDNIVDSSFDVTELDISVVVVVSNAIAEDSVIPSDVIEVAGFVVIWFVVSDAFIISVDNATKVIYFSYL